MPLATPLIYGYIPADSSDVLAKFGSPFHDDLQANGWGVVAAAVQAQCLATGMTQFHIHNPFGRGGNTGGGVDGLGMVLDAAVKRRSDAAFMVNGFRAAWSSFARQYPTRCYLGCQWTNTRLNRFWGVDRGAWSGSSISYPRFDKVKHDSKTWQALIAHTSSGANAPPNAARWVELEATARNLGPPRIDRYLRRLWDSVELPLGAGMGIGLDFSGDTPANDPSMPWIRAMSDNGVKITTEASPLLGYTHLFDFDTMITNQFLPTVETGGFAEPLANLNGDVAISINQEPGYGRTHTAWSSGVSYTGTATLAAVGAAVSYSGSNYFCILSHTSSGSNQPGTGGGASYWRLVVPTDYFIANATFANEAAWVTQFLGIMFAKNYSVMWPYYSSIFNGGATIQDYYPVGYSP